MFREVAKRFVRPFGLSMPMVFGVVICCVIGLEQLTPQNSLLAIGGNGPCIPYGGCGGIGGGMGSCHLTELGCVGTCMSLCPSGAGDYYCVGLCGDCTATTTVCNNIRTYTCRTTLFGPPSCWCEHTGYGGPCMRQIC
jgi:hypothetical protein